MNGEANGRRSTRTERRALRREEKRQQAAKQRRSRGMRKVAVWFGSTLAVTGGLAGLVLLISSQPLLPPASAEGHVEASPASHIVDAPMDPRVHRHMLEHADGSGPPGVILNYNCEDFDCAPDLIEKLTAIVQDYPANVYLAPFPTMTEALVITRQRKQEVLAGFDEQAIREFIER